MHVFNAHLKLGFSHILSLEGIDHILFMVVMSVIYTFKDWKTILKVVTSFTIAHCITLVLSLFSVITIKNQWVEVAIALTLVLTCVENLWNTKTQKYRIGLAGLFGLIHGLGFAGNLKELYDTEFSVMHHLLPFNIGLELGQLVVVVLALIVQAMWIQLTHKKHYWKNSISCIVLVLSSYWAIERSF